MKNSLIFAIVGFVVAVCLPVSSAGAASITIVNAGFEDPVLAEDDWTWLDTPGWAHVGAVGDAGDGVWNVTDSDFRPVNAPEGENVVYTENPPENTACGLTQVLAENFAGVTDYTLTVEVGNSWEYYYSGYSVQLLAGGIVIAEDYDTVWPDYRLWATSTVQYTYDPADSALVGQPLEIRLLNLGLDKDNPPADEVVGVEFDNVRLDAEYDPDATYVDAGEDMITWSGREVQLDPNVVGGSPPFTYLWSADPNDGVVFSDETVEDPTVTITKPALVTTAVAIVNPGFEIPVLADGDFSNGLADCPGWSYVETGGNIGVWNPGLSGTVYPGWEGNAPEGENIAYATKDGFEQVLTQTLTVETTYTLTAKVGNVAGSQWTGYKVQLLAGGTLLAEDDNTVTIAEETFETSTVAYTYDPEQHSALLGEPLQVRLLCLGDGEVDFDDVKLTAEGPTPSPYVVTLTLTVNNEGQPPEKAVDDTMTIDVYDDACEAARIGKGLAADNPGDFNEDCITDANDLAELATKWLTHGGLTGPIPKP